MSSLPAWKKMWSILQECLKTQPKYPEHPEYPHIKTISKKKINDVIEVKQDFIVLRSHLTKNKRQISATVLKNSRTI